jgi:uncharacterized protein (TIGR03000 family)
MLTRWSPAAGVFAVVAALLTPGRGPAQFAGGPGSTGGPVFSLGLTPHGYIPPHYLSGIGFYTGHFDSFDVPGYYGSGWHWPNVNWPSRTWHFTYSVPPDNDTADRSDRTVASETYRVFYPNKSVPGSSYYISPTSPTPPTTARLDIRVPYYTAEVWIEGEKMTQKGLFRKFVSPALTPEKCYSYEIQARWLEHGEPVIQARKVFVRPGDRANVDFTILPVPEHPVHAGH